MSRAASGRLPRAPGSLPTSSRPGAFVPPCRIRRSPSRTPRRRFASGLGRRLLRMTGWTMVWLGLLTLGFVAHQLWVTSYFADRNQQALAEERVEVNALAEVGEAEYVRPDGARRP